MDVTKASVTGTVLSVSVWLLSLLCDVLGRYWTLFFICIHAVTHHVTHWHGAVTTWVCVWDADQSPSYLGPKIHKRDMKRRLTDLDLTSRRSAQLRSISVPYIRAFWRGKQQCRDFVAWIYAAVVQITASVHSIQDEQKPNSKQ